MATKLNLNSSRQYSLTAVQPISFDNFDGTVGLDVMKLPRDAIVVGGSINVTAAFDATHTISIGDGTTAALHGAIDVATVGVKPLTLTGTPSDKVKLVATASGALTKGAGYLIVTYVLPNRGNEAQP